MAAEIRRAASAQALIVSDLALSFGGNFVLNDVNVCFEPGQITGLIGPNGAGKTSFFNCLTGLYSPQRGSILFGDTRVERWTPTQRASVGFSRSFQHVALSEELTIVENVMVGLDKHSRAGWCEAFLSLPKGGTERRRNRGRAMEALEHLGIADTADCLPAALPPGVLRLAEIARAMVGSPNVLLLDEPAAGLNSVETRDLAVGLRKLRSKDLVLVVVEHDMDLIMDVCDTIHVLSAGRLLVSGSPAHVRTHPEVVRVYLGDDSE